jgi:hypothetical protein
LCYTKPSGGMSEWSKEAVLKTVVPKGTVGSNPTPSARKFSSAKFREWLVPRRPLHGKGLPAMRVRKARRAGRMVRI